MPDHVSEIAPDALSTLATTWVETFSEEPVRPREVLNLAIESNAALLNALVSSRPSLARHPHPGDLARWLSRIENLPISTPSGHRYRFARVGHRWTLSKIPDNQ